LPESRFTAAAVRRKSVERGGRKETGREKKRGRTARGKRRG